MEHDLSRFVDAQAPVIETALAELRAGRKRSHWMWFVFPQLRGLGRSPTAEYFGLDGLVEAQAYLDHPTLGSRLREGVTAVLGHAEETPETIFGAVDAMKFRSCLTLFKRVAENGDDAQAEADERLFAHALETFYGGEEDQRTLGMLGP